MATFALTPTQSSNSFFEIYYNPAVIANNLAGTGFNVGTLIMAGKPDPTLTNSGSFALLVNGSGQPIIQQFDQFDSDNYPGIQSVTGTGSALVSVDVTSFDPAFFLTPVIELSFNTNTTIPFDETNPSALFVGSPGSLASECHPQHRYDQRSEWGRLPAPGRRQQFIHRRADDHDNARPDHGHAEQRGATAAK